MKQRQRRYSTSRARSPRRHFKVWHMFVFELSGEYVSEPVRNFFNDWIAFITAPEKMDSVSTVKMQPAATAL